jgi:hypothetical protein
MDIVAFVMQLCAIGARVAGPRFKCGGKEEEKPWVSKA